MSFLNKNQKGFVALFAVLLTSVVLAMAVGIASISLKEIVLSASASDGSRAFYAADSGIECALFWERSDTSLTPPYLNDIMICNGNPVSGLPPVGTSDFNEYYEGMEVPFGENNELCARITIGREEIGGASYNTLIEVRGSSVACSDDSNPKKVERTIRVTY